MKVRLLSLVSVVSIAAALSGCVSYGNTHALITPLGVAGYHKFKPENTAPVVPPRPNPDRMTAANHQDQDEQQDRDGEI
ncbi:hypothetical protein GCM10011487_55360 [Steroidobacter agaridevorans]|uniref:Lipoprotein n=1 Tax=Steroidobacter agaridevorans TaxID=2695856 RepID=A0A829YM05_9GAMM|nr:hypothetical protein [Steroidobacter agaridevorans]GFE83536.1 hypothetical protein GCM10011487_55360 [Steroidobacter agaridevorans]GFE86582.1 hypothetical protein GCM10011488_15360 [Steroidobacter agaridevorans]